MKYTIESLLEEIAEHVPGHYHIRFLPPTDPDMGTGEMEELEYHIMHDEELVLIMHGVTNRDIENGNVILTPRGTLVIKGEAH